MADKDKDREGLPDVSSNYTNKIKEKIKEIDQQINTQITIPQYNKQTKQKQAVLPYYYYRENKEHYMSVLEHLSKKYEFDPYIYKELEMNEGYQPGARHIFPHSGGCAQCNHYPIYSNPRDPFRPDPPILNIRQNQNHLKRWIEFTELDESQVLKEEIQEEWNAYQNRYVRVVTHSTVMHKYDARRLVYLMQYDQFAYDDFVGRTPNYIQSNFTYDKPIPREVENSYGRIVTDRQTAVQLRRQEEEELKSGKIKTQTDLEKKQESERKANAEMIEQLQNALKQQELANKNLQDEIKLYKREPGQQQNATFAAEEYSEEYAGNNATMRRNAGNTEGGNFQYNQNLKANQLSAKQQNYQQGNQGSKSNTFSDQMTSLNQLVSPTNAQHLNQQTGSERMISSGNIEGGKPVSNTKVRKPPTHVDIEKMYNPNYAAKPSSQEFKLKTYDNRVEEDLPMKQDSSKNIKLKTINQSYETIKDQNASIQSINQQQGMYYLSPNQLPVQQAFTQESQQFNSSPNKPQRSTFTHIAMNSFSQIGGGVSKKLLPSSVIKLKTRNRLTNEQEEYYNHDMTPSHALQQQKEEDYQINSLHQIEDEREASFNVETRQGREKFIDAHNHRVATQSQISQQFDSNQHSLSSINMQKQSSMISPQKNVSQQIFKQVIYDVQDENTPAHYKQQY